MPDFQLRLEWEESPRARAAELDATWARLEIYANSEAVTKVEAKRTQSVRTGIYVPLFPIAEWVIANWWFLWEQWSTNGRDPRHNLLAAREGFALPDLSFLPTETKMGLIWQPSLAAVSSTDLLFLSGGAAVVPKALVKAEFRRFVEAVIDRLSQRHVLHSNIASDWAAILATEDDAEERAFCEKAARLGCDPYDVADSLATQIESLGVVLPERVADDFCDAVSTGQIMTGAGAVKTFIDSASAASLEAGMWREVREHTEWDGTDGPWRDGYNQARALRSYLGLEGSISTGLDSLLKEKLGSLEIREFDVASRIEAISAPTQTPAPLFGVRSRLREESKRFILCRALGDHLSSGQPSLVTRSRTEHQQRNRAFAAEFLAPAESIRQRIGGNRVGEEDIEELAHEFQVSDLIIRHQIQNHSLAWLEP